MLFDNYATLASQASLDSLWLKTQVIANNLANSDTPNYKQRNVSFAQVLRDTTKRNGLSANPSNPSNIANVQNVAQPGTSAAINQLENSRDASGNRFRTVISQERGTEVRVDGNNVQLEQQQTEMWKTYAQYSYLLDRINGYYNSINTSINNMRT